MKRVLCISDSLGLPRPNVNYEDTWYYKISKNKTSMEFISYFRRKGTTNMLSCNGNYDDTLLNYLPHIVILQLGICDCAPRYLRTTSLLYKLIGRMPTLLSKWSWRLVKMIRKRRLQRTDVNIIQFRHNLINYINQCKSNGVEQLILIKIAIPGDAMINANPLILDSIALYNNIYDELSIMFSTFIKVINPIFEKDNSLFVEDGYHTNAKGHDVISDALLKVI